MSCMQPSQMHIHTCARFQCWWGRGHLESGPSKIKEKKDSNNNSSSNNNNKQPPPPTNQPPPPKKNPPQTYLPLQNREQNKTKTNEQPTKPKTRACRRRNGGRGKGGGGGRRDLLRSEMTYHRPVEAEFSPTSLPHLHPIPSRPSEITLSGFPSTDLWCEWSTVWRWRDACGIFLI